MLFFFTMPHFDSVSIASNKVPTVVVIKRHFQMLKQSVKEYMRIVDYNINLTSYDFTCTLAHFAILDRAYWQTGSV